MKKRDFLKYGSIITGGLLGVPQLLSAKETFSKGSLIKNPGDKVILFQGDSITDAGRDRGRYYANDGRGMGGGYVNLIVAQLLAHHPSEQLKIYNRGISGHKVFQLAARWEEDCLQLQPDVLSIMIGVNDFWHTLSGNYTGTVETYSSDLRALLERTKKQLPDVKLIMCEPFAVTGGSAINEKWHPTFDGYRSSAATIAKEHGAPFVPFQNLFDQALDKAPVSHWCPDGVHPSLAGAYLMAQAWLEAYKKL